ncbi:hypothetical protein WA026_014958 [Henosepilachna vigintioctopunctata]|uniref:C2 domain-containing protein n=1 Tax=Henosepilachna vigintioctopunctata TaxID=420089 RepID=A0AAW1UBS5_9CUCU
MQDEIELLEIRSSNSSKISTRKDNKIRSPPHSVKITGKGDSTSDITKLFIAKTGVRSNGDWSSASKINVKRNEKLSPRISDTISENQEVSQLSDDVFLADRKASIDSPSKTDSKSYKDRIKTRFLMIKENAGKSTHRTTFKDSTKRLIMDRIRQENDEIENEIQLKRRSLNEKIISRQKMINFFIGNNIPPQENKISEGDNTEEIGEGRDVNQSTEELMSDSQTHEEIMVEFKPPEYLGHLEEESQRECYFIPSGKPVELSRKIVGEEPRYLEDEGYFVPVKSSMPQRYWNIIEERLISSDDKKWFNCDGELKILENPINSTSLRPPEHQKKDRSLTIFAKPSVETSDCQEVLIIRENILQVKLKKLIFYHHPLFSMEHVLQRQLINACEKYEKYMENNTLKKFSNRLEASRHFLKNDEISNEGNRKNLRKYKSEVKELRDSLFVQGKEERQLLKLILSLWKNIKHLRNKNGYSSTSIKLIIHKESTNTEVDRKKYEESLHTAYQEILSEYREEFKNKLRVYKKLLAELQKSPRSESDTTTIDMPKKPSYNVDEESVFRLLKARFEESFRSPGEPMIRFTINNDHEITKEIENTEETLRRNAVCSTKISMKIICNKLPVCKTKHASLNDNFECFFDENFSILLTNFPKFITLVLFEQSNNNVPKRRVLAEVNLPVPSQTITGNNYKCSSENFTNIENIQYKYGVGSGVCLQKEMENNDLNIGVTMDDIKLSTSGMILHRMFWEYSESERNANNKEIQKVLETIVDKNGAIHVDKLADWIRQQKPDPENPNNCVLYEYIQGFDENVSVLNKRNYFRLNPHQKSLQFCDVSEIDNNVRMKLLQLRNQNEPEFDGMVVPNRIKEIPVNIFKDYKRRIALERDGFFAEDDEDNDYDSKRKNGVRNLSQIHIKVFQKCKSAANNLEIEDVLDEKYLVYFQQLIKTVSRNFFNWFRWKPHINRPLPELKKTNVEDVKLSNQEITSLVKITIKVLNGINFPDRDSSLQKIHNVMKDSTTSTFTVKPYVEVRYNDVFDRTSTADGTLPVWNEDLSLVLSSTHFDYLNPNSLSGSITVNIFDEIDETISPRNIKSRNWLGSFDAPLSAICSNNGMEGYFKVMLPNITFGYVHDEMKQTYLNLQFRVQPSFPKLSPSIDELSSNDLPYICDYIIKWNEDYNHSFPSRKFSALAINSSGKTACLVRYIKALEPPQLNNEGFDVEPEQCAKFVSLIPFTNCNHFYQNVWLSTDQLLHLLTGSVVDHAVALTCFLLALKLDVWLLLGFGLPHGSTGYVLLRERSKETDMPTYFIYDVVNAEKFSVLDPYCPLQRIYCVVRNENLWANVQRNDCIATTRFDFSRRSDWLPLFNTDVCAPTNSVHSQIAYMPKKIGEYIELHLERKIKKAISNSRPLNRTLWNKRISIMIKNNIHLLDYVYMHGRSNCEIYSELCKNISDYDVYGYILNIPYTTISNILKKIKNCGVYFQEIEDAEFSLAVQFLPLPGCIASVWIFLATVKEK